MINQTLWDKLSPKKQRQIESFREQYPTSIEFLIDDMQKKIDLGDLDFQQIIWLTHTLENPDKASELETQVENLFE